jgi:hypothetical protein
MKTSQYNPIFSNMFRPQEFPFPFRESKPIASSPDVARSLFRGRIVAVPKGEVNVRPGRAPEQSARERPGFVPQRQVHEDCAYDALVLDETDDTRGAAAIREDQRVGREDPLEEPGPTGARNLRRGGVV